MSGGGASRLTPTRRVVWLMVHHSKKIELFLIEEYLAF